MQIINDSFPAPNPMTLMHDYGGYVEHINRVLNFHSEFSSLTNLQTYRKHFSDINGSSAFLAFSTWSSSRNGDIPR